MSFPAHWYFRNEKLCIYCKSDATGLSIKRLEAINCGWYNIPRSLIKIIPKHITSSKVTKIVYTSFTSVSK